MRRPACARRRARLGGLDQLVHSAGIWNEGPIGRIEAAQLEEIFRVNVFSAFYLVREALPILRPGRAAATSSSSAPPRASAARRATPTTRRRRARIQSLAMSLAVELAPAVAREPGLARAGCGRRWPRRSSRPSGRASPARFRTGASARSRTCVHAVLYLASEASAHLVGEDLCVSGGALLVVPRGQIVARTADRRAARGGGAARLQNPCATATTSSCARTVRPPDDPRGCCAREGQRGDPGGVQGRARAARPEARDPRERRRLPRRLRRRADGGGLPGGRLVRARPPGGRRRRSWRATS